MCLAIGAVRLKCRVLLWWLLCYGQRSPKSVLGYSRPSKQNGREMKWLLALGVVVYLIRRPEFRAAYRRSFERTVDAGSRDPERVRIRGVDY